MRDALRANDQERYFRILARTDLLLPTTQPAAGPSGWGTWTSGGRTHVLAFTSATALRACVGDNAGANRRIAFADLAAGWPNPEWWLAINPGLPVEGYLPAWYVAQLSRGEVRLPGRTLGARARLERAESLARARAAEVGRDPSAAPAAGRPDAGSPGRAPLRATASDVGPSGGEAGGAPTRIPPASVALPRRPGEATPATWAAGSADPARARRGEQSPPPATTADRSDRDRSRPSSARTAPAGTPSGNGAAASGDSVETPRRSFFEPTSGRGSAPRSPLRSPDRAAPPSRFGRSDQPFPRRGPVDGPRDPEVTQAFFSAAREPTPSPRPSQAAASQATGVEATQPLPPRRPDPRSEEPTRAFGVFGAAARPSAGRRAGTDPEGERTQPLPPRPRPEPRGAEPAEELPPSVAEPVSGPPATRRGFTPIVIEGTIIESRDLDLPAAGPVDPFGAPSAGRAGSGSTTPHPSGSTTPNRAGSPEPRVGANAGEAGWSPSRPGSAPSSDQGAEGDPWTSRSGSPWMRPKTTGSARVADAPGGSAADATLDLRGASSSAASGQVADATPDFWTPRSARPAPDDAERADGNAPAPAEPRAAATAAADGESTVVLAGSSGAEGTSGPDEKPATDFQPANAVEEDLLGAAGAGSTDTFLSTLLLARVLLPVAAESAPGSRPGDPGFVWRTEELDGETFVVVYTSPERLAERVDGEVETAQFKFVQLIRRWPDEAWSFAVNPGTPVGAKLPGEQIVGLANWAAEVGLGDDVEAEEAAAPAEPTGQPRTTPKPVDPSRPVMMQKAVAPSQVAYYLERGYDRVSGFVHRANELAHLNTPAQLHDALGLNYPESPFSRDAEEIYVLRWPAYRPSLYRIPYGGQNEAAMRAMEGWVIERPPFRGNGFAPGESSDVVAEFKVDSARLPHGAQLWRVGADGSERVVAILDSDALRWREVGAA
ncbi:hypothetical protein E1211_22365 [Micromonospora sp. 15K316]|nr:hypothetical protein E1211_22365 [Micromonospora sp. 15K316]